MHLSAFQFAIMLQHLSAMRWKQRRTKLGLPSSRSPGPSSAWPTALRTTGRRSLACARRPGFAEGSANPAGMKATSGWFSAAERGLAGGFFNMGASLGAMLAAPLVAWAILTRSWQFAFGLTGAIGFAWVALWLVFYQSPSKTKCSHRRNATTSSPARSVISLGKANPRPGPFWPAELRGHRHPEVPCRSDVGHADVLAAALPDDRTWIRSEADRDVRVAAIPGSRSGLHVRWHHQHRAAEARCGKSYHARRSAFTVGALLMMGVAFVGTAIFRRRRRALSLAAFAHQTLLVTVITMASDLFKRSQVATVAGIAGTCGNAGVLLFSLLMGALVTRIGGIPFFIGLAALDLFGAVLLWTLGVSGGPTPSPRRVAG